MTKNRKTMYPIIPVELTPGIIQTVVYFFTMVGVLLGVGIGSRA